MSGFTERLRHSLQEITDHLENGIIPFWLTKAPDPQHGGFLTSFDGAGRPTGETDKCIITQTRMIWGLSAFFRRYPEKTALGEAARQGVDFFIKSFWDQRHGGWHWKTRRDGSAIDQCKVVYGQGFAVYALSEYSLATNDPRGLEYAEATFDLLQKYCADTLRGGYYENMEPDWSRSPDGFTGGDRKSLDIHMHLMEAFTTLTQCSQKEIHRRKLDEVTSLILTRMIHPKSGCGMNQFDLDFRPIPAIDIRHTWNAERLAGETVATPTDTTSYGHNVELGWLLNRAGEVLGRPADAFDSTVRKLVDHAVRHGLDREFGGIYRDGLHEGEALVRDKEWWQNCEVLVGFLDAYERLKDDRYLEAFFSTWEFDKAYLINPEAGEWHQLADRSGKILVPDIGNPFKAIYHTGRAMMECKERLERLIGK